MSQKRSKKERATAGAVKVKSWWNNGGMVPIPAVNTGRPFDFQIGNPTGQFTTNPYAFGNAQYIVSNFKIPDDWYQCSAFDTATSKLYQSIRENLRSNLSYYESELKAYLANVMFLQAVCSIIERDFAFMKFRDPQHPTFENIWGNQVFAREYQFDNPGEPDVTVTPITKKAYLTTGDYAENLTYLENVIIPKLSLIVVPPAMAEFVKWMFGNVFIDEVNPAHAQFYWNELNSIPYYDYEASTQTISLAGTYDVTTISLDMVASMLTTIASEYGIIIADLKRAGAQMVTLALAKPGDAVSLRYDEQFFAMLRNAYSSEYRTVAGGSLAEAAQAFFLVDFVDGMSSDLMCTSLFGAGALVPSASVMVHPIKLVSQSVLVEIDRPTNLVLGSTSISSDGTVKTPSAYEAGTYALTYTSNVGGFIQRDSTGWIQKATSFAVSDVLFISDGETRYTLDRVLSNCDPADIRGVNVPVGTAMISGNLEVIYARLYTATPPSFAKTKVGGCYRYYVTGTGSLDYLVAKANVTFSDGTDTVTTVATKVNATKSVQFAVEWYTPDDSFWTSVRPDLQKSLYKANVAVSLSGASDGYTVNRALTGLSALGDIVLGEQITTATGVLVDASTNLMRWISQEVDYHIPLWGAQLIYDVDTATPTMIWPQLEKETNVSTSYNTTELEALLYQMYYSLFFVHSKTRIEKKA